MNFEKGSVNRDMEMDFYSDITEKVLLGWRATTQIMLANSSWLPVDKTSDISFLV